MRTIIKAAAIAIAAGIFSTSACAQASKGDWANFKRYETENASVKEAPVAVFMGNSITDHWRGMHPEFFTSNNFIGRGISGQVSSQMLCRFRPDVLDLCPKVVVILAGTNDLACNNGVIKECNIVGNIASMVDLARAHGIVPIVCSVPPADRFPWRMEVTDVTAKIKSLNKALKAYADANKVIYVDYWPVLATAEGAIDPSLSDDALHPNTKGYDAMEPVILEAIKQALR